MFPQLKCRFPLSTEYLYHKKKGAWVGMVYSGEKLRIMGEAFGHKAQPREKKERKAIIQYQFQVKNIQVHLLITEK